MNVLKSTSLSHHERNLFMTNLNPEQIIKQMACEYVKKSLELTKHQYGFIKNKIFKQLT